MKLFTHLFLFSLVLHCTAAISNDNRHPRAMMKHDDSLTVISFLSQNRYASLPAGIYASAQTSLPAGNITPSDRRARATLAKNAAFCLYMGVTHTGTSLRPLSQEEKQQLLQKIIRIFQEMRTDIPTLSITTPNAYQDWQWHSKEYIDLLCAYDFLAGISQLSADEEKTIRSSLALFAANFYTESTKSILGLSFFGTIKNNHALMTAGALGMASIVLSDFTSNEISQTPAMWFQTSLTAIDDIFWRASNRQSNDDGSAGYAEGPYYFRYAMLNVLPFFRAVSHSYPDTVFTFGSLSIRHPWYDSRYRAIVEWANGILQPDGTFPAIGDTYMNMGFPETALLGKPDLIYPFTEKELNNQLISTVDMRANYLCAATEARMHLPTGQIVFPKAGSAVFRSDSISAHSWYTHIIGKQGNARTSGAGHSQADASSFLLWNRGLPMFLDAGYVQYSRRQEVGNAQNHNMILVNEQGPPIGQPLTPGSADAFFINNFSLPHLHHIAVQTSYNDASIERSFFIIDNRFLLTSDNISASAPKRFTFQLHGNGMVEGTEKTGIAHIQFTKNGTIAQWERDSSFVEALIITPHEQGSSADSAVHEEQYGVTGIHTVARIRTAPVMRGAFASLSVAKERHAPLKTTPYIESLSDVSSALGYEYGEDTYIVAAIQSDTNRRSFRAIMPSEHGFDIVSDATLCGIWNGENYDNFALFFTNGTLFKDTFTDYDIISSSERITYAVSSIENSFVCYVSKPCTLRHRLLNLIPIYSDERVVITDVHGDVVSWGQDSVILRSAGNFTLHFEKQPINSVPSSNNVENIPYPSPVKDFLTIPIQHGQNIDNMTLTNSIGNHCEVILHTTPEAITLDMRLLPCGYYTLTIRSLVHTWHYGFIKTE
ncbi:MAG: heparinase II/III family protein [Candidatus Kapabacteria bacterium]|nr:heparinase II/III family protein [Candidatus Kapabacteria bacterium]